MHARSWLTLLTLPLVAGLSVPMVVRDSPPARSEAPPTPQDPLAELADVQDVLALIRDNYVDAPDLTRVVGGGIQAALERAHPLNAFLTPEDLRLPDPGPAETGLKVVKRGIYAQVLAVRPGSPAAEAGILPGDVIRRIDGQSLGGMSAWALERALRGQEGSEIALTRFSSASGDVRKCTLKRAVLAPGAVTLLSDKSAFLLALPDLGIGRGEELKKLLQGLDRQFPLVLDLRNCVGGLPSEAARVAAFFLKSGPFATLQEAGKPESVLPLVSDPLPPFAKVALLQGPGTIGAAELLAAAAKKQGLPTFGERTAAMALERSRFPLKQGGAIELVNRRWVGAGGEKLDRQGVGPQHPLRNLKPEEDPLPRILQILSRPPAETPIVKAETHKHARRLDPPGSTALGAA
ncbi:MAG: PDZ domain-containing protein [Acidobacteria bacterium]|nr:PDZ domain-containing protein [Acidobacteriota bacterium]